MRDEEPFMPTLDWVPRKNAQHIYKVILDGKTACVVQIARLADQTSVWKWKTDIPTTNGVYVSVSGEERTARLAVRRTEEAYFRTASNL